VNDCEKVSATAPGITITKDCTATHDGTSFTVNFNGTVTNTGSELLHNVVISDNPVSSDIAPAVYGQAPGGTLAAGAAFNYTGSYTGNVPPGSCVVNNPTTGVATCTFSDIARVDALSPSDVAVSATDPASCTTTVTPKITVTKDCTTTLVTTDAANRLVVKNVVSGQVCNNGTDTDVQVTITSLTDTDVTDGSLFTSLTPKVLAVGACGSYSGFYFPTTLATDKGTASDTVTASATAAISGQTVSANKTASCDLCPVVDPRNGTPGAPNGNGL
jgi:hypothetical protein